MNKSIICLSMTVICLCSCQKTTMTQLDKGFKDEKLLNESNYSESLAYYEDLLEMEIEQKGEENERVSSIYNNISVIYMELGNNEKSLEYSNKARLISETLGDDSGLASNYYNMGEAYFYMKDYKTALDYYKKALKIKELLFGVDSSETIQTISAMADCYSELGIYEDGLNMLNKMVENDLKENGGNSESLCQIYGRMANIYERQKDASSAEKYYKMAIESNKQIKKPNMEFEALMYGSIGNLFDEKDAQKAIENYQKAIEYYSKSSDWVENQVYLYGKLMSNYSILGDMEKAQEYGIKTCSLTEQYGTDAGVSKEEIADYKEELKAVYYQLTKDEVKTDFEVWYRSSVLD